MGKRLIGIFVATVFLAFLFSTCIMGIVTAAREETLVGTVVKQLARRSVHEWCVRCRDVSILPHVMGPTPAQTA